MAHGRQEFALVGYSADLEKRPLKFVDPIPASRICSACGNLPRQTYTLMCGHAFCEPCYESCATTSECVCPLDGDVCDRDDVTRKEYRAEQLLRRKVRTHVLERNHTNYCMGIGVAPLLKRTFFRSHLCFFFVCVCDVNCDLFGYFVS